MWWAGPALKSRWGGVNGPVPGRPLERAVPVPVPCCGPGVRPKHGSLPRAVLARSRWPPGRAWAGPKKRAPCRANGLGLHGHIYALAELSIMQKEPCPP